MTYGERFKALRELREMNTLEAAKRLGRGWPTAINNLESQLKVPNFKTIEKHAQVLGCKPWELLEGVETEYHLAAAINDIPGDRRWDAWRKLAAEIAPNRKRAGGKKRARAPASKRPA